MPSAGMTFTPPRRSKNSATIAAAVPMRAAKPMGMQLPSGAKAAKGTRPTRIFPGFMGCPQLEAEAGGGSAVPMRSVSIGCHEARLSAVTSPSDDRSWSKLDGGSVQAVSWLIRRTEGDRILVIAATRPSLSPSTAAGRQVVERTGAETIYLSGLSAQTDSGVGKSLRPEVDDFLIGR
jgi:hypothetical protein